MPPLPCFPAAAAPDTSTPLRRCTRRPHAAASFVPAVALLAAPATPAARCHPLPPMLLPLCTCRPTPLPRCTCRPPRHCHPSPPATALLAAPAAPTRPTLLPCCTRCPAAYVTPAAARSLHPAAPATTRGPRCIRHPRRGAAAPTAPRLIPHSCTAPPAAPRCSPSGPAPRPRCVRCPPAPLHPLHHAAPYAACPTPLSHCIRRSAAALLHPPPLHPAPAAPRPPRTPPTLRRCPAAVRGCLASIVI
ncbi:hypothetical protein B0H14DRAFT_3479686 [Mycena olivaceomarginata]|nr:hypothetical protein B0H14DRAFT_3479686 [Mycena olivaceomarginata]